MTPMLSWATGNSILGQVGFAIPFLLFFKIWISLCQKSDGLITGQNRSGEPLLMLLEIHILVHTW